MKNKRAELLNQVIVHLVLIGIIFALFIFATAGKINSRGVRQQVVEKEIALLIDSAVPGMSFSIYKENIDGAIQDIRIEEGKVFATVAGLPSVSGYPYFSRYSVGVEEKEDKFVVSVK
jgi:hypothetical protein